MRAVVQAGWLVAGFSPRMSGFDPKSFLVGVYTAAKGNIMPIPVAERSKGKNTHTAERSAACDLIRGNKAVDLFPRIKSQAAGRSAPLCVCFYPKAWVCG
jgi:hypothetical protein